MKAPEYLQPPDGREHVRTASAPAEPAPVAGDWTCGLCAAINHERRTCCARCGQKRPSPAGAPAAQELNHAEGRPVGVVEAVQGRKEGEGGCISPTPCQLPPEPAAEPPSRQESFVILRRMISERDKQIAALTAERDEARRELNPTCAEETLIGAIRNLKQAHLSERGNAEEAERQRDAALARAEQAEQRCSEHVVAAHRLGDQLEAARQALAAAQRAAFFAGHEANGADGRPFLARAAAAEAAFAAYLAQPPAPSPEASQQENPT